MPQRVVQQSVVVIRDGKRVRPVIGESFDFTDEEIQHAGPDALREPKNETRSPARVPAAAAATAARGGAKPTKPADEDDL